MWPGRCCAWRPVCWCTAATAATCARWVAALAVLGQLRRWRWIPRKAECGTPCQTCRHRCAYQAITPAGAAQYEECFQCLDCVAVYQDPRQCLPLVRRGQAGDTAGGGAMTGKPPLRDAHTLDGDALGLRAAAGRPMPRRQWLRWTLGAPLASTSAGASVGGPAWLAAAGLTTQPQTVAAGPAGSAGALVWRERALLGFGTTLWLRAAHQDAGHVDRALEDTVSLAAPPGTPAQPVRPRQRAVPAEPRRRASPARPGAAGRADAGPPGVGPQPGRF